MPVKLDQFPAAVNTRHPWDEYLDGEPRAFKRGEDFDSKVATFVQMARAQAEKRGGKVRSRMVAEGQVVLQYVG